MIPVWNAALLVLGVGMIMVAYLPVEDSRGQRIFLAVAGLVLVFFGLSQ